MKINNFESWYKLYTFKGNFTPVVIEANDFLALLDKADEVIKSEQTDYIRVHCAWHGEEIWRINADFKKKRWDISVRKTSWTQDAPFTWCERKNLRIKLLELFNKLNERN